MAVRRPSRVERGEAGPKLYVERARAGEHAMQMSARRAPRSTALRRTIDDPPLDLAHGHVERARNLGVRDILARRARAEAREREEAQFPCERVG